MQKPSVDPRDHPAILLGMRIIKGAYEATESLTGSSGHVGEISSKRGGVLILGYSGFFFHWIDRVAWQCLGARRDYLVDRIRDGLIPALSEAIRPGATEKERAADKVGLGETLEGFQRQFSEFTSPFDAPGGLEGSLPWEFGVWLADLMQCGGDHDFILRAASVAFDGTERLDPLPLLEHIDPTLGTVKDGKVVVPCQACPKKFRLPSNLGRVRVTCPYCNHQQLLST